MRTFNQNGESKMNQTKTFTLTDAIEVGEVFCYDLSFYRVLRVKRVAAGFRVRVRYVGTRATSIGAR